MLVGVGTMESVILVCSMVKCRKAWERKIRRLKKELTAMREDYFHGDESSVEVPEIYRRKYFELEDTLYMLHQQQRICNGLL